MPWYEDDEENPFDHVSFRSARKAGKPMGHNAPHYPNSAERVLLTQMMQKSGQTEEEVRADKSNRQKLAVAAKSMSKGKGANHRYQILLKRAKRNLAAALGVPAYHPDVEKHLDKPDHFGFRGISTRRQMLIRKVYG